MLKFLLRRLVTMILTALCLTFIVFYLTNLPPNLEKVAKSELGARISDAEVASWLDKYGYSRPLLVRYGEWLGVAPGWTGSDQGVSIGRCVKRGADLESAPKYCGVLQGSWGFSTVFKDNVGAIISTRLTLTGILMFWVMVLMVPTALLIGILAGMREGSKLDRSLSTFSIATSATPEYVSGVILIAVFASSMVGLKWFKGTATSAMDAPNFENFFLPVLTVALYGIGYIARMTRASMTEVMTAQYIRTARLKGVSFRNVVMKHALRNALIAPFTVIMLQFPWLLNGVVITETLFNYKGFGWTLVQAAGNNDIQLLLGCSVVAVIVVLVTQLISDVGYVFLNPRIRIS
ncbi:peptide/nickel transport system permease protein [Defluviimonas denitrificans]|jgi:peptide/nickel transport system permease protein|uniref:Peptide/nickel transport system permease protein n=1 Tax=Albidovulum denitrificans TaxID=404881 RepID=A0A2S8SCM9_9RHOB|nr:ABC transporter permease [Defluviimonas denitrificans]PQV58546.1 peptide/nickel transport system permease protein [Defluviimonas denitrificans]